MTNYTTEWSIRFLENQMPFSNPFLNQIVKSRIEELRQENKGTRQYLEKDDQPTKTHLS